MFFSYFLSPSEFLGCNLHIFCFTRLFYSFQCTYMNLYCSNFIFPNVCSKVVWNVHRYFPKNTDP
jgi:hypothetical protein